MEKPDEVFMKSAFDFETTLASVVFLVATLDAVFDFAAVVVAFTDVLGVISMARSQNPNSASSQFFICYGDCTFLDGQYAAFGKVIEGMETVDDFLKIDRRMSFGGERSTPVEPIVMKTVEVIE